MRSTTISDGGTARLDEVAADELHAVTGGTYSLYDRGAKTGVFIQDNGAIDIWKNGVFQGVLAGGKFTPCSSHCTTA